MSNLLHPDYNSPSALKKFMEDNGMAMQKKFGQNFLTNEKARVKIIDELDINENSTVWEVGPGTEKDKVTVVPGDKVIYDKYAGTNLKMDGEDYLILKMSDIIAIVE